MIGKSFSQYNETGRLRKTVLGRWKDYAKVKEYVETVNESQKSGLPEIGQLEREFEGFRKALEERGVEVCIPKRVGKFVYDQLTPRDLGVVIGNRFVLCNMAKASRRYEAAGIFSYLLEMDGEEPNILIPPGSDMFLEGGDIMVDKGCVFVGISERTNKKGLAYLDNVFGKEFNVVPVHCREKEKLENTSEVLHLDCTFNPVGKDLALIYVEGIKDIPREIKENYRWIEIDHEEQELLATNVLSLDQNTVISRSHEACRRVNEEMRKQGLEVIELDFVAAPSTGGSFRCCTLPLQRG